MRSRFTYAGHVERMGNETMARADAQKVEGKEARKTEIAMGIDTRNGRV